MSSVRFPGVQLTEWRSRLVDAHERLFPDARPYRDGTGWALACAGWPDVGDGWRRILERACERLEQALASEPSAEAVIIEIKQKYGSLRLHVSTAGTSPDADAAVALAIDLAEARPEHVCETCGDPGRPWSRQGWLQTRCDRHGEGRPLPRGIGGDIQLITRFEDGRPIRSARRYLPDQDRFEPVPVPDEE